MKNTKIFRLLKGIVYGNRMVQDPYFSEVEHRAIEERKKSPKRTEIINYLIQHLGREVTYLEIGVRNPNDNFNNIKASLKYSVDPGLEFEENPVDFPMTSDQFFNSLRDGKVLDQNLKFDVIFIDGLHLAEQVDRDIKNSLEFVRNDGFVILHDCNPPTEFHARENHGYHHTPARGSWNGTTWKAFVKWRTEPSINSCCIDSDWGVGIISKDAPIGSHLQKIDPFFEYVNFAANRHNYLNLISFEELKATLEV